MTTVLWPEAKVSSQIALQDVVRSMAVLALTMQVL